MNLAILKKTVGLVEGGHSWMEYGRSKKEGIAFVGRRKMLERDDMAYGTRGLYRNDSRKRRSALPNLYSKHPYQASYLHISAV